MLVSVFNRRWAAVILEVLTRYGVRYICIVLGSRFISLTLAAAENFVFIYYIYFDERGLGYLALGLAKVSKQSVAVIVIFGTAVVNFYSVLIEVGLIGEKLIFLIVDRSSELIDCGANQVIRQSGMFVFYFTYSILLSRSIQDIFVRWLVFIIDYVFGTFYAGGVYINCSFVESLYGEMDDIGFSW